MRRLARDFLIALAVFFAFFAIAAIDSRSAWPAPAAETAGMEQVREEKGAPLLLPVAYDGVAARKPMRSRITIEKDWPRHADAAHAASVEAGPVNSTPASDRPVLIGVMALFFAAMSAVTIGLWRHLRRAYSSGR